MSNITLANLLAVFREFEPIPEHHRVLLNAGMPWGEIDRSQYYEDLQPDSDLELPADCIYSTAYTWPRVVRCLLWRLLSRAVTPGSDWEESWSFMLKRHAGWMTRRGMFYLDLDNSEDWPKEIEVWFLTTDPFSELFPTHFVFRYSKFTQEQFDFFREVVRGMDELTESMELRDAAKEAWRDCWSLAPSCVPRPKFEQYYEDPDMLLFPEGFDVEYFPNPK